MMQRRQERTFCSDKWVNINHQKKEEMMPRIVEITTEREFVSKLRTYYRKARRKGYQRNEISFLGLMEYTGSATSEFEYQSDKYFSVGPRAYCWAHGNSLLSALIEKWESEIEKKGLTTFKTKKQ